MLGEPGTARDRSTTFECWCCGFRGRLSALQLFQATGIAVVPAHPDVTEEKRRRQERVKYRARNGEAGR